MTSERERELRRIFINPIKTENKYKNQTVMAELFAYIDELKLKLKEKDKRDEETP